MLEFIFYPPILRGFAAILIAGAVFPLPGVFVLRLNLVPLRFTLMHASLLGSAAALALGADPLLPSLASAVLMILVLAPISDRTGLGSGQTSAFFMVLAISAAFAIIYKADVPAKDAFEILWGNIYALGRSDLAGLLAFCCAVLFLVFSRFRLLSAVMFDREIAFTVGVPEKAVYQGILVVTGITVAFAMRLVGALLLDSLLLLPAIAASLLAGSLRGTFFVASLAGVVSSAAGFALSLAFDLPVSSTVGFAASVFILAGIIRKRTRRKKV